MGTRTSKKAKAGAEENSAHDEIERIRAEMYAIYQRQPDKRKITIESDKTKIDRLLKEMREITGE